MCGVRACGVLGYDAGFTQALTFPPPPLCPLPPQVHLKSSGPLASPSPTQGRGGEGEEAAGAAADMLPQWGVSCSRQQLPQLVDAYVQVRGVWCARWGVCMCLWGGPPKVPKPYSPEPLPLPLNP